MVVFAREFVLIAKHRHTHRPIPSGAGGSKRKSIGITERSEMSTTFAVQCWKKRTKKKRREEENGRGKKERGGSRRGEQISEKQRDRQGEEEKKEEKGADLH
jgi:hypothetical protein